MSQKDVVITKASYDLKIKVGTGGFDRDAIVRAEVRLNDARHSFPEVAALELGAIEEALEMVRHEAQQISGTKKLVSACVELRALSSMFQFPLVGEIAEGLLQFCISLKIVTPLANDMIKEYLNAFRISLNEGPRTVRPHDRDVLLHDLEKAAQRVLREQA